MLPKNIKKLGLLKSSMFLPVELHLEAGFPGVSSTVGARCPSSPFWKDYERLIVFFRPEAPKV